MNDHEKMLEALRWYRNNDRDFDALVRRSSPTCHDSYLDLAHGRVPLSQPEPARTHLVYGLAEQLLFEQRATELLNRVQEQFHL